MRVARLLLRLLPAAVLLAGCASKTGRLTGPLTAPPTSGLTVRFLDVGQGDAALLQWPGHAALVDGGDPDTADSVVASLKRCGVTKLDWVVASHPHADHIGGLPAVLRAFPVANVLDSGVNAGSHLQMDYLRAVKARKAAFRVAKAGEKIDMGGGVAMEIYGPPASVLQVTVPEENNCSIVARVVYRKARILFPGDMEAFERQAVYDGFGPKALRADVLKSAHHGSRTGTDSEFMQAVKPRYVVISCARGNRYGHPHAAALEAYRKAGCQVFRTDLQGDITVYTDGSSIRVEGAHAPNGDMRRTGGRVRANHRRRVP